MKDIAEQLKAVKAQMKPGAGAPPASARDKGPDRAALLAFSSLGIGSRERQAGAEFSRKAACIDDYVKAAEGRIAIDASRWGELRLLIAEDLGFRNVSTGEGKEGCIELCRKARVAAQLHQDRAESESERDRLLVLLGRIRRTTEMVEKLVLAAEIAQAAAHRLENKRPDRDGVTPLKSQNTAYQQPPRPSVSVERRDAPTAAPAAITVKPHGAEGVAGTKTSQLAQTGESMAATGAATRSSARSTSVDLERAPQPKVEPVPRVFRPLRKPPPTRMAIFRTPEDWVADGGRLQYVEDARARPVDIVIGIDFGTCFTKAAVGMLDKVYPVTWEGVSAGEPSYLLASEYTELRDGELFIGQHPKAERENIRSDLKLPFINNEVSPEAMRRAVDFLALVLRYVRAWVYRHHGGKLGRASIRWQLNIGAPSNGLESDQMISRYRALAATAWARSQHADSPALLGSGDVLWNTDQAPPGLLELPYVCPEFVAQMAGYVKSPQRQRGLHALVDVGGGTLDTVTFIVHAVQEEDTFPFLVPEIHPLGTHGLVQNRLTGLGQAEPLGLDELAPVQPAAEFARSTGVPEGHVLERDELFASEVRSVITRVFGTTKRRRYRLSDAWSYGVRTFFTGGGSPLELYGGALRSAPVPSQQGLIISPLPPRPGLDGFPGSPAEYQRISVACGLAQDRWNLGRIVRAKEVEDDVPIAIMPSRRLDRDDLYPK